MGHGKWEDKHYGQAGLDPGKRQSRRQNNDCGAPIERRGKRRIDVLCRLSRWQASLPGHCPAESGPTMRFLAAVISTFFLVLLASAQNPQAPGGARGGGGFVAYPQRPVSDPEAVARGKVLFDVNCSFCHGADARGGDDGPNLLRSDLVLEDQNGEYIGPVLLDGRDRGM